MNNRDELEIFEEEIETAISEQTNIEESFQEIAEAREEAIVEGSEESLRELIIEELREQGVPENKIEDMADKGVEMLQEQLPEKQHKNTQKSPGVRKSVGSEGSPRPYNYPTEPERKNASSIPAGKNNYSPSRKERLEAMKSGIKEFLASTHKTEHEEEKFSEQLKEIETELDELSPDPEEEPLPEVDDVTEETALQHGFRSAEEMRSSIEYKEWEQDLERHKKYVKLKSIEGLYSAGITPEDLGTAANAQKRIVARAHLPLSMWPENKKEPYNIEEFEKEIEQLTEDIEY